MSGTQLQEVVVEDFSGAAYGVLTLPAFGSNISLGSVIVMGTTSQNNETPVLSDTLVNTFSLIDNLNDATDNQGLSTLYAFNSSAGADQISGNFVSNSAGFVGLYAAEFSGLTTSDPLEVHDIRERDNVGNGASIDTNSMTPTQAPAMVWGITMEMTGSVGAPNAGAGFTSNASIWSFGGLALARTEYKSVATTAGVTASFTAAAANGNYVVAGIVFKEIATATNFWHSHTTNVIVSGR